MKENRVFNPKTKEWDILYSKFAVFIPSTYPKKWQFRGRYYRFVSGQLRRVEK